MKEQIESISIVGSGNVAFHLAQGFAKHGIAVVQVSSRNKVSGQELAQLVGADFREDPRDLDQTDLILLCIPDKEVVAMVELLSDKAPIAYTAGNLALESLDETHPIGVFYPLQSFTRHRVLDLEHVPFLIESNDAQLTNQLVQLASTLSTSVHRVNSKQRQSIHQIAVWVNNFTNHLVYQAEAQCKAQELQFDLFIPLLKETFDKLNEISAFDAQTGPARRGDTKTLQNHLTQLSGIQKEIYHLLSNSIGSTYGHDKL